MNSVATVFTIDFYSKFRPHVQDSELIKVLKTISFLVGASSTKLALAMARFNIRSMFEVWDLICTLIGSGFVGMYILVFSVECTLAWLMAGAVVSIVVTFYLKCFTDVHWAMLSPAAAITCIVIGYVISVLLPIAQRDLTGLTVYSINRKE